MRSQLEPADLAELTLLLPIRRRASAVHLRPMAHREDYELCVMRGRRQLGRLEFKADLAERAIGLLARLAELDPLAETGSPEALVNVAKMTVRSGRSRANLMLAVTATPTGLEAELDTLLLDGSPPAAESALRRCVRCGAFAPPGEVSCDRDGSRLIDIDDDPRPGGTIGAHRIESELGRGAMGVVFAATHVFLGRAVAIKVLHRSVAGHSQQRRAFLAEARAASRVHHPGLLEVTDYGVLADGRPFVVMERLDGQPLSQRLEGKTALPPAFALKIAQQVAQALAAAHQGGVVHNDLKPSNVMLLSTSTEQEPRLKVIDFGAASLSETKASEREFVVGTPHYMSPERIRGEVTDGRSDVYALGVVLFRMLSGRVPFARALTAGLPESDEVRAILRAHLEIPAPQVDSPEGPLPAAIVRLLSRMLAKDPALRHPTADELSLEIGRALAKLDGPTWRRWLP